MSSHPRNSQRGFLSCPPRNVACTYAIDMSAQLQWRPSVRWTRERDQAKSASPTAATSKAAAAAFDVAQFIYGSNSSLQLHRQHLEGILGAAPTNGSLEPATPSDARTHFYKTSRPARILHLPSLTEGRRAVRERENGGRKGRLAFSIPLEQRAIDVMRSPPSIPPAARTLKTTTTLPPLRQRSEP